MAKQDTTNDASDIVLAPITEGVILKDVVSHYSAPQSSLAFAENMHNDTIGVMTTRKPFYRRSSFSTQVTAPINCILAGSLVSSSYQLLYWQDGRDLKLRRAIDTGGGTFTNTNFFNNTSKNRYDVVQNTLLITNFGNGIFWTQGANSIPLALTTGFPNSVDVISGGFSGRVWGAASSITGPSSARVYYTDVIPLAGVTSVTGSGSFLGVNANSGESVTGLIRIQNILCVFTQNAIFRIYNTQSIDNTPVSNVGVFQQEAIVKTKLGYYFYHPSGVYKLNNDGSVQEVSKRIAPFLQRVPTLNQQAVFGWGDEDHIYFSLGTNIQGMQSEKTYYICYTLSTQVWTIYSTYFWYPTCASTAYFTYVQSLESGLTEDWTPTTYVLGVLQNGTGNAVTFGNFNYSTENSNVYGDVGDSGGTAGQPIFIDMETQWKTMAFESHLNKVNGIAFPHENGAGLLVSYQVDKDLPNVWREVGTLDDQYITLFRDFQSEEFNRIRFRVSGQTYGEAVKLGQPTLINVEDHGYKRS